MRRRHYSIRGIAEALDRSVSTISDELKRNRVKGRYVADKAQHKAYVRRQGAKYQGMKIVQNRKLQEYVEQELYDDQSPEAIAGFLQERQRQLPYVSKDSIRRYITSPYGRWVEYHRSKIKRNRRRTKPRMKPWQDRVFIDQRPSKINLRREVGHAEVDFIVSGKSGKGILLVVVDRKLRVTCLEQILKPTVASVTQAMLKIRQRYPEWKSMTTDNDILFKNHLALAQELGITIYFCFPGHAWEKGSIENTNRWIRRYIPKSSDISRYSKRFIKNLEAKINRRIMKTLNYYRPEELLKQYRKRKQRLRAVEKLNI